MNGQLRIVGEACLVFGAAALLGLIVLIALFKIGALSGIGILFYRGVALTGLSAVVVLVLFLAAGRVLAPWLHLDARSAIAASALSLGLNLAFLVILPVTIDRSITVFMLGQMAVQADRVFSADDVRAAFVKTYLGDYRQIERRLDEQLATGNIEKAGNGYRITTRGRAFVSTSRTIARLFEIDQRFVAPPPGHP